MLYYYYSYQGAEVSKTAVIPLSLKPLQNGFEWNVKAYLHVMFF